MAFLLGKRIKIISTIPDDDSLGRVEGTGIKWYSEDELELADESDCSLRKRIDKEVMVYLAGQIAEKERTGNKLDGYYLVDDTGSVAFMAKFPGSNEQIASYYEWLSARTRETILVKQNWHAIEILAKELLTEREIKGGEAHRIIENAYKDFGLIKSGGVGALNL